MTNTSSVSGLSSVVSDMAAPDKAQLKRAGASKDFEALLIAQMLRTIREEGSGWMGTGDDEASSAAFGLGEEQLARALTARGGLGLSRVIEAGLKKQDGPTDR